MNLRNDDDVHRYQRIFIDFRGWNVGELIKARYVTWAVWAGLTALLFITIFARTLGVASGLMWSATLALGATVGAAPHLSNETGPVAWCQAGLAEYQAWQVSRRRTQQASTPITRWTHNKEQT